MHKQNFMPLLVGTSFTDLKVFAGRLGHRFDIHSVKTGFHGSNLITSYVKFTNFWM
jgi:hypothetical protein